jgi:hypothetical protein
MNVSIANISNQLYTGLFDSRRFTSTTLSLDSVIFKNGGVVGPDRFDAIGKAAAGTKAWSELMAKVNDTSVSDNDLNTWLQQLASQPARNTVGADGAINHYLTAQIAFSRFLLDRVNKSGRADLTRNTPASPVSGEPQLFHLDQ